MNLKISLFNKSIIKSDFKRYWWISAVYMLLMALFVLPNAVYNSVYPESFADHFYLRTDQGILAFVFAVGLGGMLFSYLHRGNSASCLHGLPVTRKTQYLSHIFSAVVLLLIPIAISSIVIFIESICLNSGETLALKYCVKYFYTCSVYAVATLMVTAFAAMLSGNTIAAYVFTGGFIILPIAVETLSKAVLENSLYGFTPNSYTYISEKIYILGIDNMCSTKSVIYIVLIAVLFFVNMWLYKIRSIESYEEIVAFSALRPVFMYVVAVFFGLFGWAMLKSMFEFNNVFFGTMPLGIVALVAAFMLNRKSFGIRGLLKPVVIFIVGIGLLQLCFILDITGYERRIPDISNVESVEPFVDVAQNGYMTDFSEGVKYEDVGYKGQLKDEKDIDNVIKLHKAIVDNRKLDKSEFDGTRITIKYNMNNGKTIERSYTIDNSLYTDYMKSYYENEVYKKMRYPIVNDNEKEINFVTYYGFDSDSVRLQHLDYDKLMEALNKDIMALDYDTIMTMNKVRGSVRGITIDYNELVEYEGKKLVYNMGTDISLNSGFKNTQKLIDSYMAAHNQLITPEEISSIEVFSENYNFDVIDVTSKEDINAIYSLLKEYDYNLIDYKKDTVTFNINMFSGKYQTTYGNLTINTDEIPEVFKKYIGD